MEEELEGEMEGEDDGGEVFTGNDEEASVGDKDGTFERGFFEGDDDGDPLLDGEAEGCEDRLVDEG